MMKYQNATNKMTQFVTVKSLIWQFVTDAETDLTLRSKLKVKGHQQWYATHHLEEVYLHAKYAKPVLNDKKGTAEHDLLRTDGQIDHYRASVTKWRGPN
jgi:hypothetical protein